MTDKQPIKVLFVCMGNICRSPTAEGAFRKLVQQQGLTAAIHIDSAGTHAYHIGEAPDRRSQTAASNRQIDISMLRGRKFMATDFHEFDYLLAMDQDNFSDMQAQNPGDGKAELALLLDYASQFSEREVPDPYYGGKNGFEFVLDLIQDASAGLLQHIRKQHNL
ncbi:MAG: low molecular weight phosphotyrosine protein phosphatase [Gammaproteobacteria bacterium]|nr:low molecular weight phosphotyrosine protein phosphatase [Gammaproteobacteria bacterium]MBL6998294.1 low molecular weight phosphotyrosine protein phosphatase [Gammaproteobacteria bacterium]